MNSEGISGHPAHLPWVDWSTGKCPPWGMELTCRENPFSMETGLNPAFKLIIIEETGRELWCPLPLA